MVHYQKCTIRQKSNSPFWQTFELGNCPLVNCPKSLLGNCTLPRRNDSMVIWCRRNDSRAVGEMTVCHGV